MRTSCALVLAAALTGLALPASGHGRSTSISWWEIRDGPVAGARIRVSLAWLDLERGVPDLAGATPAQMMGRPGLLARADDYLAEHLVLLADGVPCVRRGSAAPVPAVDDAHLARSWRVVCTAPGPLSLQVDPLFDRLPSHVHLARVHRGDAAALERVFVLGSETLALDDGTAGGGASSVLDFVRLGVKHIATGVDHLVFLFALLLLGLTLGEVVTLVTGFTVAHSLTLGLAVLGVVRPSGVAVEALIGLSIAVVAVENMLETVSDAGRRSIVRALALTLAGACAASRAGALAVPALALAGVTLFSLCYLALLGHLERPHRLRWLLAFVFGLVHGFGFAGVLAQMQLPPDGLVRALFGFNLGVEIGQMALVVLVWPLLHRLLADERRRAPRVQVGSAAALAAGVFWFVSRAVGPG